ncbi:MAG: flagella basal body P-ring formation protein FlgA [Janthinobacterium lividum]
MPPGGTALPQPDIRPGDRRAAASLARSLQRFLQLRPERRTTMPVAIALIAAVAAISPADRAAGALPACSAPTVATLQPSGFVRVDCAAPPWHIFVGPKAPAGGARPILVRRGDAVTIAAAGAGFRVTIEAIADNDAAAGARLRAHDKATGARLNGLVEADGSVVLPAFSSPPESR